MFQLILVDSISGREQLLPFTYTRPAADIRNGIQTNRERWESLLSVSSGTFTASYLQEKFPFVSAELYLAIDAQVIGTEDFARFLMDAQPQKNTLYFKDGIWIAGWIDNTRWENFKSSQYDLFQKIELEHLPVKRLLHTWDIFSQCDAMIRSDFQWITNNRKSIPISSDNIIIGPESSVFIEEGAKVHGAVLNSTTGPIYIAKDAEVMEGSLIRGPFSLGEHSQTKMGAKIYGATSLGPHVKVGGELNNVVIFGYSSKAHDGFLGNSVIGEWCNLGADTNNSNLKNNYASVKLWDYAAKKFADTGLQFCGLMMGDHSKCGINTMFNTGTVVGVSSNIFGSGFPRNFIPSFAWGGAHGFTTYQLPAAFETAEKVYKRRNIDFDAIEKRMLEKIFEITEEERKTMK